MCTRNVEMTNRGKQTRKSARRKTATTTGLLLQEVRARLKARAEPAYREQLATTIGTRDGVIGVRVPAIRAALAEILAEHRDLTADDAIALMDHAARSAVREELLIATFMLAKLQRKLAPAVLDDIDRWIESVNNWETCDQLATNVAAPLVARDIAEIERLATWAGSDNPWLRRFSLATAAALNQKGRKFPAETLRICELLIEDADVNVRKAVGWAIREAYDSDAKFATAFLRRHAKRMPRSVLTEASKKLPADLRDALKRAAGHL